MGPGVSAGAGQSSLGYLFGGGETAAKNVGHTASNSPSPKPASASPPIDKQTPAGIHGNLKKNYYRADGQNCGNFITDRPSTRDHAAPGGGPSLGELFGGNGNRFVLSVRMYQLSCAYPLGYAISLF